jgi:hypothetical protein
MQLTDVDKTVIGSMIEGRVNTVETFLAAHCDFREVTTDSIYPLGWRTIRPGEVGLLPADEPTAFSRLIQFLSLWKKLESAGLIVTVMTEDRTSKFRPIFASGARERSLVVNTRITTIVKDHANKELLTFA